MGDLATLADAAHVGAATLGLDSVIHFLTRKTLALDNVPA
jgi:hypothetical protein